MEFMLKEILYHLILNVLIEKKNVRFLLNFSTDIN